MHSGLISNNGTENSIENEKESTNELPEGQIEEKVQIDRRKLEDMITGNFTFYQNLPSAFDFFPEVEKKTGTQISWPSKLKIGAKTKKDPFVKIVGLPENVEQAKEAIFGLLKIKKDRITLKMEIGYTCHSHIIGRGGRNTQEVMRETNCHIHFPDSNKHNDVEKNNQVSIAGSVVQVERARAKLRLISPVTLTVNAEINPQIPVNCADFQRKLTYSEVACQVVLNSNTILQLTIKASMQYEEVINNTVSHFLSLLTAAGHSVESAICMSVFDLRVSLLQPSYGLYGLNNIRWIAFHTKTQMQFSPQGSSIMVMGSSSAVFAARRYLTGLLPISIQFEKKTESMSKQNTRAIESKYNVSIGEKKKSNANGCESLTVIKSHEANISNLYAARQVLLQSDATEALTVYEYAFMQNFLEKVKGCSTPRTSNLHSQSMINIPANNRHPSLNSSFSDCRINPDHSFNYDSFGTQSCSSLFFELNKNREPQLGKTALSEKPKSEFWRTPGLERQMAIDRDKMLLKANQATYRQEITDVRQPTDLWSGYGFSNSLPADILKLGLKKIWEQTENNESGFGATTSINKEMKMAKNQNEAAKTKGLASVREEEELSDYNQSISSNISSPSQTAKDFQFPQASKRPPFAASASIFESASTALNNDIIWDIQIFVDPAMVLSQLGCSEYLPQFRDQEIDMQAFLLLDEQNLKDIGVSTMGARKKIFNAILKLRDSARKHGYSI